MNKKHNRRPSRTARQLRRIEDKLELIMSDINFVNTRVNQIQGQIDSRNSLEMDVAIHRLKLHAESQRASAQKQLQDIRSRFAAAKEGGKV